jgi:AmmeMemoRadiSam system protein A
MATGPVRFSPSSAHAAAGVGWPGPEFDADDDAILLAVTRRALALCVDRRRMAPIRLEPIPHGDALLGAFVTLHIDGELRGCMGRIDFDAPFADNLVDAAASVARDPRFDPLTAAELPLLEVEVSVLAPPRPLADPLSFDAPTEGIMVECFPFHAVLLPQVAAERGWDARRTLETTCRKAGLPADAWRRSDCLVSAFAVHIASEPRPAG